jgi:thiamine biosynthesis lipoprotein
MGLIMLQNLRDAVQSVMRGSLLQLSGLRYRWRVKNTASVTQLRQVVAAIVLLIAVLRTPAAQAEWLYREEAIMGTRCAVELWATDRRQGEAAMEAVLADMRRIDALMSTYKPDSEVSLVNAGAGKAPVPVSGELFQLLETAQQYSALSSGAFDITYASVGYLYDYRAHQRPDGKAIAALLPTVDYRQLKLDSAARTVAFGKSGMRIDLGGIAKGHAVDRGIQILKDLGFTHAMVNAGGDTRVSGDRFGKPWVVGIRHPDRKDEVALRVPLEDAAFSTSGDYERFFDEGGVRYHHILDPKTGLSPREVRSVTVIASNATRTDGLTKTVFILGPKAGLDFINSLPDADAIVIAADGKVSYSKGLQPP